MFDLTRLLGMVQNAGGLIQQATTIVNEVRDTGTVLSSDSEEQIEAAIQELEAQLPALRQATQDKLRGTSGT